MTIRTSIARFSVAAMIGATAFASVPTLALADTSAELQAQLDDANAHLNDLYDQASAMSEQVNQTQSDLDATNAEIEQKQGELEQAQAVLSSRVATNYKTGGVSLASIIFDSNSFDDLVSRMYYASKVSESDAQAIQQVKDIENDLNSKKAEQQQLLADQQSQQDQLNAKVSETQSYVSSLDQQVQAKIAEEQAAYEAQQRAAQEAAQQQAAADGGNYVAATDTVDADNGGSDTQQAATDNGDSESNDAPAQNNGGSQSTNNGGSTTTTQKPSSNKGSSSSSSSGSSSNSGSGLTSAQRNAIVSAAWSKVGSSYVYGATGPSSFDCSGFVQWCYAQAGISLPRTSESQGGWGRSTSNPQAGDIVCWGGHVGIYMGGGKMIDAGNPSVGVSYRSIWGGGWYRTK